MSTTTSRNTVRDALNSNVLGKESDAAAQAPLGDILSILLDTRNASTTISAVTATGAVTPTATGAVTQTATGVTAATAVTPASAAYASPDQSILAALSNANSMAVNACVTDIIAIKAKLDAAVVDISAMTTKLNAAVVDISALRAELAAINTAGTVGGATEASVTVTSHVATLAANPSSVITVNAISGGTTGVKTLVRDPAHTLVTGEVYWDGNLTLTFAAADAVTACDVIYSKADKSQKVSCLMANALP